VRVLRLGLVQTVGVALVGVGAGRGGGGRGRARAARRATAEKSESERAGELGDGTGLDRSHDPLIAVHVGELERERGGPALELNVAREPPDGVVALRDVHAEARVLDLLGELLQGALAQGLRDLTRRATDRRTGPLQERVEVLQRQSDVQLAGDPRRLYAG